MVQTHETTEIDGQPVRITLTWRGSRRPALAGVELTALMRGGEITGGMLRKVQLGRLIAAHRPQPEPMDAPAPRVGRPRDLDAEHYRAVAETYRAALEAGQHPVQAVADHFGVTPSTARRWVHVARHRHGLLPLVRRGQAG